MKIDATRIKEVITKFQTEDVLDLAWTMNAAKFIACQMYPFSEAVGLAKREYNLAHVRRKTKFAELVKTFREQTNSIREAERLAEQHPEYKALYEKEYTEDARYEQGKLMLMSMREVHGRMAQEIAEMRYEKRHYEEDERMEAIIRKIDKRREGYFPKAEIG